MMLPTFDEADVKGIRHGSKKVDQQTAPKTWLYSKT